MAITRVQILKFLELVLTIVCIGLHYNSGDTGKLVETMITHTAFGGFLIILVGEMVGMFTGEPLNKKIDIFFSLLGCVLFITAGSFAIQFFDNYYGSKETRNIGIAKGAIAIINGAVFLVDAGLSFRG